MTTHQQRPSNEGDFNPQQQPPAGYYQQPGYPGQQPPGYYPPQGGYPYPPQPEPKRTNGLATAGFVVALIGAVLSLIPIIGTVSWAISPIGLVLSVVGLIMYRSRHAGRGLAIAGVVLGVFGLIMCVVYTASVAKAVSTPVSSAPVQSAPEASTGGAIQQATGSYGTPLTAGDLTVTASAPKQVSQPYLGAQMCSNVTYQNNGSTQQSYNVFDWKFRTSSGAESSANIPFNSGSPLNSGDLAPGGTVSGEVCADNTVKDAAAVVYSPGFGIMHQLTWQ